MAEYEFAIKKDVLNSGKTIHTPVCRKKSKLGRLNIFPNPWERIVKLYDKYVLIELDWTPSLTYQECEEHIHGFQLSLTESINNQLHSVEFHALQDKKY